MGLAEGLDLMLIDRQDHGPFAGTSVTQNGRVVRSKIAWELGDGPTVPVTGENHN
jgi:hypothetical protein